MTTNQLYKIVAKSINEIGIEVFKQTSMFQKGRKEISAVQCPDDQVNN